MNRNRRRMEQIVTTDLVYTDLTLFNAHGSHGSHGFFTRDFFEHEIRRRPTDRREVISRITRIIFHTELTLSFLTHTDLTDLTDLLTENREYLF